MTNFRKRRSAIWYCGYHDAVMTKSEAKQHFKSCDSSIYKESKLK